MPHMEGIFINGEKAKFHPEDILDTDASQYTEEIGESVTAFLTEHITNPSNPPIDTSLSIAGAAADAKKTGDEISQLKYSYTEDISDLQTAISTKAEIDGNYENLTAGTAEQLASTVFIEDNAPYIIRKSGGGAAVGHEKYEQIVGGSLVWNQLCNSDSVTTIKEHKYYVVRNNSASVEESDGSTIMDLTSGTDMVFDLSLMFGSAIADYIYALECSRTGDGAAWVKRFFPNDYYEYNAGEIKSVSGLSEHKTVGFNAWDEEWESGYYDSSGQPHDGAQYIRSKNYISVIPGVPYYFKTGGAKMYYCTYNQAKEFLGARPSVTDRAMTFSANVRYIRFNTANTYGTTYKNDICINLSHGGERDGQYEPYDGHSYTLDDSITLRGIPKLSDENSFYYANGDTYDSDGTVIRRNAVVDLGTLTWQISGSGESAFFYSTDSIGVKTGTDNALCSRYVISEVSSENTVDKCFSITKDPQIRIRDTDYTDATAFKAAMNGVMLVYKLASNTTEQAQAYTNPQAVNNSGTEEYVAESIIPVGHVTEYSNDLRIKIETAPNSPDRDGDYVLRQTEGSDKYIPLGSVAVIQDFRESISDHEKQIATNTEDIESLKSDLNYTQIFGEVLFSATSGSFIRPDGTTASNSGFSISEAIELKKDETIRLVAHGYLTSVSMISLYLGAGSYRPLVISASSNEEIYEYTATEDCDVVLCYDNNASYKHACYIYLKVYDAINAGIADNSIDANMLNADFENIYYVTDNKLDPTTLRHGRIIVNTGAFYADENYRCSQLIPCEGENNVYVWSAVSTGVQAHSFVFYNADGNVIGYSDYYVKNASITENAKYLTVTLMADQIWANPMITYKNERPFEYIPFGRYIKDVKTDKANYMHLFNNIGIVGDSLSSGAIFDAEGNHQDMHGYSWLANICRDINATPAFFSASGLTTKAWLESEYKTALQSSTTQFEAYYIALGTNDQNAAYGIGTIDDVAGTDSFVGYYKQIIDVIHTKAPNAVIFCVSMYNHDATTWSAMINSIANLYSYCYYIDFINKCETKLYIPNTRIYTPFVENWHYTGLGYIEVGHTIENVTNNVIDENLSDFKFFTAGFFET